MSNLIACSKQSVFYSPSQSTLIELSISTGEKISELKYEHPICAICALDDYLAVAIRKEKSKVKQENLFIYKQGNLLFSHIIPHDAIQLMFADFEGKKCLLTLNSGDMDVLDLETKDSKNLLGSIATGTSFEVCDKYILSADRDARIRISNYPNTYDIHAFAFLHEEFVSSLLLLDNNLFVSADGDGKLMKWDFDGNNLLVNQVYDKNVIIRKLAQYEGKIAAIVEGSNDISLINKETFEIEGKIELQSQPISIVVYNDVLYGFNLNHVFKVHGNEVTVLSNELFNQDVNLKLFTLEGQRVNSKVILKKGDKETEDYKRWRNPEKLSAGSK